MLPKTVRGAVAATAVVVEELGKRVADTAAAILEKTGVDVSEVERKLGGQFPPSAKTLQTLAEEAVTAGRAGVDLAVGVARNEVEKAFEKVGDQVTKVGVVLAFLESKLREVEEEPAAGKPAAAGHGKEQPAPAPRADDLFGRGWEFEDEPVATEPVVAERVEVDEPVEVDPPVSPLSPATEAAVRKAVEESVGEPAAGKWAVPAKKAPVKKAPAEKAAVGKKATVRKTATGQPKQPAQNGAEPKAAAKRTATKKTTVRKATSTKQPDARDE
ncbi:MULTISPECIES: hypothetical protein [Kitasatospora]|uniref:Histone n=1 Tax=Kitasatospora cathayae TaxID=3004092 RepID=A0ABY7Q120_9ACTN|nr:hypothetical protein [Kitasatospora sp. HUAS 3-15]WBP86393.1 hypothetical protein O1G21_11460 [Kitasatospora sp. HUAS 3-15]